MSSPYQKALIPGPNVGITVSDPEVLANLIKKSKNILLIIGADSVNKKVKDGKIYTEWLYELGRKANAKIIANGAAYKYLVDSGKNDGVMMMPSMQVIDRLRDPNWINFEGKGDKFDLVIISGMLFYYASQLFSTLRNFTTYRTLCIDRYHHPNARFSLANLEKEEWINFIEQVYAKL
ncbi:MAG: CO dehydrogenase/acetyl-CoA synthase complex subunit epsilon [Promethearchaeota archaeon]